MLSLGALLLCACLVDPGTGRAEVARYPIPNSTFPIAQAVKVSGDIATYYISGQVPPVVSKDAELNSPQAFGDTKTRRSACSTRSRPSSKVLGSAWPMS